MNLVWNWNGARLPSALVALAVLADIVSCGSSAVLRSTSR